MSAEVVLSMRDKPPTPCTISYFTYTSHELKSSGTVIHLNYWVSVSFLRSLPMSKNKCARNVDMDIKLS